VQTQRDHVHAHQFMMGRLGSALVLGDASGAEVPGRRAFTGLTFGVLIAVLVVAGFAVYGWIVPGGSKAYREAGLVLVEKETGSRYVVVDGFLRPVADLPTALLWQGPNAKVKLISQASLAAVPRGGVLGIPGGPREVPAPERFVTGPWLVCLPERAGQPGVAVNFDPGALSQPVPADRLAVVRDPGGDFHLLTRGLRHRVTDEAVLVALRVDAARAVPASPVWLNQIPAGPDLAPAVIPRAGRAGPRVGDRAYAIGTRFRQDELYFVLRADGLAAMSRTEFLFAGVRSRSEAVNLSGADLLAAPRSADRTLLDRLPDLAGTAEHRLGADQAFCLLQRPSGTAVSSVLVEAPRFAAPVDAAGRGLVRGPAGGAMVVVGVPVAENAQPAVHLLAADGVAFPLKDAAAASALKINKVSPVPFPSEVLAAARQGPMLSREAVTVLAEG
jgi:type VII secretion protein EccB